MGELDIRYQEYVNQHNLQGKTEQEVVTHMLSTGWLTAEQVEELRTSGAFSVGGVVRNDITDTFNRNEQEGETFSTQARPQQLVISEEQAQEQVVQTIYNDVQAASKILSSVDNGVITKYYDDLKTGAYNIKKAGREEEVRDKVETYSFIFGGVVGYLVATYLYDKTMESAEYAYSNVEESVALQAVGAHNLELAKNGQLSKREYYLQNKEHLKTMLIRRLYLKDESTGISFIDRNRGNKSQEEFAQFLEEYINEIVDSIQDLGSIKAIQTRLTTLTPEQTEEYYNQLLNSANMEASRNLYNELPQIKIKQPEVPDEFDLTEPMTFEEVFQYERGTEFSAGAVTYNLQTKMDLDYALGAYNKHQQLSTTIQEYFDAYDRAISDIRRTYNDRYLQSSSTMVNQDFYNPKYDRYGNQLRNDEVYQPDPQKQAEHVIEIFESYFANPINPNLAKEKLEELISKNNFPMMLNQAEDGTLSLDLSAYRSKNDKNKALSNMLRVFMQEQDAQLEEVLGGDPDIKMMEYSQRYSMSHDLAYGKESSEALAKAMEADNQTIIKRVTGTVSSVGMGLTVVGGVLCVTPLAPLGSAMVTTGNILAVSGMVAESVLSYTEALTRENVSEEELKEITKATLMNAGGFAIGAGAGKASMKVFGNIIDEKLVTVFNKEITNGNRAAALSAVFSNSDNLASFMTATGAKVGTDFLISYAGDLALMGVLDTEDDWQSLLKSNLIGIMVGMSSDIKDVSGVNGRFGSNLRAGTENTDVRSETPMVLGFGAMTRGKSDTPVRADVDGRVDVDNSSSSARVLNNDMFNLPSLSEIDVHAKSVQEVAISVKYSRKILELANNDKAQAQVSAYFDYLLETIPTDKQVLNIDPTKVPLEEDYVLPNGTIISRKSAGDTGEVVWDEATQKYTIIEDTSKLVFWIKDVNGEEHIIPATTPDNIQKAQRIINFLATQEAIPRNEIDAVQQSILNGNIKSDITPISQTSMTSDVMTERTFGSMIHSNADNASSVLIEKLNNAKTYEELQALKSEIRDYCGDDKQAIVDFWRTKNEQAMLGEDVSDMKYFATNNLNVKVDDVEQKFVSLLDKASWERLNIRIDEKNKFAFNAIADILRANGFYFQKPTEFYNQINALTRRKDFISENADLVADIITAKDNNGRRRLSQETILDIILSEEMTVEALQVLNNAMNIKNGDNYRYSEDELLIFLGEGKNEHLSEDYQTSDESFVTYGIDTKQKGEKNIFDGSKKEVRDSEGKLLYTEEYRQSELEGKFDIIRTDSNGKETVVGLASRSVNGELSIVEKTLFGADNTKTDYVFVENTNGRLSYSKITDSDGKVLVENKVNFRKIDETHCKSVENGVEYNIEYTSDKIIVTSSNGKTAEINIVPKSKLDAEGNTKELGISEELLPVVKQLPGSVLMSVKELGLDGITLSRNSFVEDNAQFNLTDNRIYISPEYANNVFVVLHELGHFIDYKTDIHSNLELLKIYNEERNNLINNGSIIEFSQMSYFTSLMHINEGGAITEMIAETHAINNASNTDPLFSSRGALLQQHFPKTYAKITQLLNEAKLSGTPTDNVHVGGRATSMIEQNTSKNSADSPNSLRPKKFETTDAYKLTEVVSEADLARLGSELLITVGDKKVLTPEADAMVRSIAEQIHRLAGDSENDIVSTMIKMGLGTEETLKHRTKSVQSLYDKIKNALIDDKNSSLKDAVGTVFDGVGVRTVRTIENFAEHPAVKKYLDAGDYKTAYQKAIELESDFVLQSLKNYVDLCAEGKNEVTLTRISNYMGEDGIPYFTERQLQHLKAYAQSKGVNIPIVERVMDYTEHTQAQTESSYRKKSTTKVRGSGYTALQMNFVTKDGFSYEWQYRGEKLNVFAEAEHIPYDLRTNKDIIGTHTELTRLYEPLKDLLTNKEKMSDTMYEEYNHYLTAYYEYLRLVELGFVDGSNPPMLPKGFDERLRAENLELIHEIADKIKENPEKEAEYLNEYESRLVRNTDENTTTTSYTEQANLRAQNRTINIDEAQTRLGANREGADVESIARIIDACKNAEGGITDKLVTEAEFLMAQGVKTDNIINTINEIKSNTQKFQTSNNLKINNYDKDFYLLNPNFFKDSSIETMPQLSHLTSEEIAIVLRQSISENSITGVIPSPYIDKQYIINARDKQNNIVNIIYEIDKNGKPLFVSKETIVELKDKNIIRKQFADGSKIVEEIFKSENLFSTAQIGYQKTWYDSNGIQVRSEVMAPTKRAGEYTLNSYERNQSNGYIKTELGKVRTYGSREQGLRVEKNLTSPDGTNTKILKISGPKGNAIDYVITDKDGTQLLSVQRRHRQIDENHYESSLNGQKYSIDFSGEKITTSKIDENGNIIESITLDNKQLTPELMDLYKSLPGDYFFKIKATGVKVNVSNNVQTYGGACYDPITNEIRLSPDIKDNLFFISHELGHALDFQVLNKLKDDPQFKAIVNTDILNYHNAATLTEGTTIDYFSKYDISTNTTPYAEIIGETLAILSGKSNTQTNICGNRTDVLSANYAKSIAYASKALLNPEAYLSSKNSTVASKPEIDPILKTQHLQVIQAMRKDLVGRHQMVENTKTLLANNNNLLASNEFLKTKIDEMLNMYENIEKYTDDQIIEKIAELSQIESSVLDKQIQGFNTSFYGSIKIIAGYIPIGKRILEGFSNAKNALLKNIEKQESDDAFYKNYTELIHNPERTISIAVDLSSDVDFKNIVKDLAQHYCSTRKNISENISELIKNNDIVRIYQVLIEESGVGPTKLAQIISNMTDLMDKIETYSPELRSAIENTRSDCIPTRTIQEAQEEIDLAFNEPNSRKYEIVDRMGTASMGETYLAKRPDGSLCVIKMLKKGVNATQLNLEKRFYTKLISAFNNDPVLAQEQIAIINQCYNDWADELSFQHEYGANKLLANGAKRYTVADAIDISENGQCLVMDVAQGIQMKSLMEMLKFYKENPNQYSKKYDKKIQENPWLADPERILQELPETLSKTFIEQYLFMKEGGKSLMHGDPHMGNYFIYQNAEGKLMPEFIDTGLCIVRNTDDIKADLKFFSNYIVGNTDAIAEYFVGKCDIKNTERDEIVKIISREIKAKIFNQKVNITGFADIQSAILNILDENGLSIRSDEATAMKAQFQFLLGIADAYHLSGRRFDLNPFITDLPKATYSMIKEGINPLKEITTAFNFALYNQVQATSTAGQFIFKSRIKSTNNN